MFVQTTSLAAVVALLASHVAGAADWPQFRGTASNSVSGEDVKVQPPTEWSDADGKNIAWKAKLPGRGPASPIVVGNKVIVTASSGVNQERLHVLCFDTATGKQLWERQFWATGRTLSHPSSANAAPTPASDGKLVFAFYSSNDMACLDLDGNLKWFRGLAYDYPAAGNDVGMSSSPIVAGDVVVAQVECQGDSFATGIDKRTGEPLWRVPRPREASWTSPIIMRGAKPEDTLVLLQSPKHLTAHKASTGEQVWSHEVACDGISSPAAVDGLVYVASKGVTTLKPGSGAEPEVVWNAQNLQPGAASVIVDGGKLYIINRAGVLNCASADDGKVNWRVRLEGEFWGTPVLAGNRLYSISQKGKGQVVEMSADGKKGEIVGTGQLEGEIMSSPAIADGALFVRSDGYLWKIAAP
jgi:outer membrane protein assembly factor BamB